MLSLSRKADYAIVAMADLARHAPALVSAREMAHRLRLPLPALHNILTRLMHFGLVVSVRGPRGGYRLSRPPEEITMTELIDAVGGPFKLAHCCPGGAGEHNGECRMEDVCPIRDPLRKVNDLLRRCLGEVTLEQVIWNRVPSISRTNEDAVPNLH